MWILRCVWTGLVFQMQNLTAFGDVEMNLGADGGYWDELLPRICFWSIIWPRLGILRWGCTALMDFGWIRPRVCDFERPCVLWDEFGPRFWFWSKVWPRLWILRCLWTALVLRFIILSTFSQTQSPAVLRSSPQSCKPIWKLMHSHFGAHALILLHGHARIVRRRHLSNCTCALSYSMDTTAEGQSGTADHKTIASPNIIRTLS